MRTNVDTIVTTKLTKAVDFIKQEQGLERAGKLFDLARRALNKAERKQHESQTAFTLRLQDKYAHQSEIAHMAYCRLYKAYKGQLFKLFTK
jgi:hypothetical protein